MEAIEEATQNMAVGVTLARSVRQRKKKLTQSKAHPEVAHSFRQAPRNQWSDHQSQAECYILQGKDTVTTPILTKYLSILNLKLVHYNCVLNKD
jgi:hypothetical protein